MSIAIVLGLIPSLLILISRTSSQDQPCVDVNTNKTFKITDTWRNPGKCSDFLCDLAEVPGIPNIRLPMIVKRICGELRAPDDDWRNCYRIVPFPKAKFPKCCPQLICGRDGYRIIIKAKSSK